MGRASTEDSGYDEVAGDSLRLVFPVEQRLWQKSDAIAHLHCVIGELEDMKAQPLLERILRHKDVLKGQVLIWKLSRKE